MRRFFRSTSRLFQDIMVHFDRRHVTLRDVASYKQLLEEFKTEFEAANPQFMTFNKEFDYIQITDDQTLGLSLKLAFPKPLMVNVKAKIVKKPDTKADFKRDKLPDFESEHLSYMYTQANNAMSDGNFAKAEVILQQSIERISENGDPRDILAFQSSLAQCWTHLGKDTEAIVLMKKISEDYLREKLPLDTRYAYLLMNLAQAHVRQKNINEAIHIFEVCKEHMRSESDQVYVSVCKELSNLYLVKKEYIKAVELLTPALERSKAVDRMSPQTSSVYVLLAFAYTGLGLHVKAENCFLEALAILREKDPLSEEALELVYYLAICAGRLQQLEKAVGIYEDLLQKFLASGRKKNSVYSNYLLSFASVLVEMKDLNRAQLLADEAVIIETEQNGEFLSEAITALQAIISHKKKP